MGKDISARKKRTNIRIYKSAIKVLLSFFCIILFTSCGGLWDMVVLPFSGINKSNIQDINKYLPEATLEQYVLDTIYIDSLIIQKYALNLYRLEDQTSFSPLQTRMYYSDGRYAGSWELCSGNAKMLDVYDSVPIVVRPWSYNNRDLNLQTDINIIDTNENQKEQIIANANNHDYTMMVLWSNKGGYYTKRHLRQIKRYVNKNSDYNFYLLYVYVDS